MFNSSHMEILKIKGSHDGSLYIWWMELWGSGYSGNENKVAVIPQIFLYFFLDLLLLNEISRKMKLLSVSLHDCRQREHYGDLCQNSYHRCQHRS